MKIIFLFVYISSATHADKNIVKAVGVKAGSKNGGNCSTTGQAKPNFTKKTEAPKSNFGAQQK